MKIVYKINKIIIIINLILALIPFLGLLFMIITGFTQIVSYTIWISKWKHIHLTLQRYFIAYPFLVIIALGIIPINTDASFVISLSISALLAIGFLF